MDHFYSIMKIFVSLMFLVNSQMILEQTKKEFSFQPTLYGFIPYGGSITGNMHFVKDLCTYSESGKKIIITEFSKECKIQQQLWNGDQAIAFIFQAENFDQKSLITEKYNETEIILTMSADDISELKKNSDSRLKLNFPIKAKSEKPVIEYIVYELDQQSEVIIMLQEFQKKGFNFKLDIIYFTTHQNDIEQLCQGAIQNSHIMIFGERIDCNSPLEKNYITVGNLGNKLGRTQILQENVMQICILQTLGQEKWNQYREQFRKYLQIYSSLQIIESLKLYILQQLGNAPQECWIKSFANNSQLNPILQTQVDLSLGISPNHYKERATLLINGYRIFGNYSLDQRTMFNAEQSTLFLALCEAYYLENRPAICPNKTITIIEQPETQVASNSNGIFTGFLITIIGELVLVMIWMGVRRLLQKYNLNCFETFKDLLKFNKEQDNESEMTQQNIESNLMQQEGQSVIVQANESDVIIVQDNKQQQNNELKEIKILDQYLQLQEIN